MHDYLITAARIGMWLLAVAVVAFAIRAIWRIYRKEVAEHEALTPEQKAERSQEPYP